MNSKIVSEPTGEQMTLFSLVGSLNPANHTALQEKDLEKKMTVTSGLTVLKQLGSLNQITAFSKMFSELLIGTGDWYSTRCMLTWKLKGTKYKRLYFQLQVSAHRTGETGFGLLPTPTAHDFRSTHAENSQAYQNRMQHPRGVPLVEHMQREMDGKSFQLNPPFVAEMMGFPPDWTELPFLSGETNP